MVKEMIPGRQMSDEAATFFLVKLVEIYQQIGADRFHAMIVTAIETCDHRPTISVLRRIAGVAAPGLPQADAVLRAWDTVSLIVRRHIVRDGEGNPVLTSRLVLTDTGHREEAVPSLPESVHTAIRSLGGWAALADCTPEYWSAKFAQFKELVRLEPEDVDVLCGSASVALVPK